MHEYVGLVVRSWYVAEAIKFGTKHVLFHEMIYGMVNWMRVPIIPKDRKEGYLHQEWLTIREKN